MTGEEEQADDDDLATELSKDEVALVPQSETADPQEIIERKIPSDVRKRYEIYSYRNAAVILSESHQQEFNQLITALSQFAIPKAMIRRAGGNESEIPKLLSEALRPQGWYETVIRGDLVVTQVWKEQQTNKNGKAVFVSKQRQITRAKYLDGHKIDYVKGRVAFDLEWNSKDQTFDRDLYAFSAFAQCGIIDVGVLVTRGASLNPIFRKLGPALDKNGNVERKKSGQMRMTYEKYGASTTWMGKLLYRLNAGRNGGCPVLAVGITPACIPDWNEADDDN